MDEKQAQLDWEAQAGRIAAVGALMTAALIVGAIAYRIIAVPTGADNTAELLPQVHAHPVPFKVYGILTGLTMSPAMDAAWPWLLDLFGGRPSARSIHFICASLLAAFLCVHLLMVVLAGPINEVGSMITGRFLLPPDRGEQ